MRSLLTLAQELADQISRVLSAPVESRKATRALLKSELKCMAKVRRAMISDTIRNRRLTNVVLDLGRFEILNLRMFSLMDSLTMKFGRRFGLLTEKEENQCNALCSYTECCPR